MKENGKETCRACWENLTSNLGKVCAACLDAGRPERPNPVKKTPRKLKGTGDRVARSEDGDRERRISPIYTRIVKRVE